MTNESAKNGTSNGTRNTQGYGTAKWRIRAHYCINSIFKGFRFELILSKSKVIFFKSSPKHRTKVMIKFKIKFFKFLNEKLISDNQE